jgi:hypothetical protein
MAAISFRAPNVLRLPVGIATGLSPFAILSPGWMVHHRI